MMDNIGASTLPCGSPFSCRRQRLFFPFSTTKKRLFSSMVRIRSVRCTSVVDRVVDSRQVHEDSTGDQALLIANFRYAPSSSAAGPTRFSRTKSGLFWNESRIYVFCHPVQYESFEQLVGVAEQGDRSKALRNGWVLSGLQ